MPPAISVVVPTVGRASYLDATLRSLTAQRAAPEHELLVVDDGPSAASRAVAADHGVPVVTASSPGGLNAARNTGIRNTRGELIAFVDDDVAAPPDWLTAVAAGGRRHPDAEAFGGPIRARLEGPAPRGCGREQPPLTTLDLGAQDRPTDHVWGANMIVRRTAVDRIGEFDETLPLYGEEAAWVERLIDAGGEVVYLAAAGLDHRRVGPDARLRALARAELTRGRRARALNERRGEAPALARELRDLGGAGWHTLRRRCPLGVTMLAHATGRTLEALARR